MSSNSDPSDVADVSALSQRKAGGFYGRRAGKTLRAGQADLIATLLPELALDLTTPAPADLRSLFRAPVDTVWMESGFGGGEHMIATLKAHPRLGMIGAEPFVNGMAKALAQLHVEGLEDRVRLHMADAVPLLDWLPPGGLGRFYLLYADPWPKTRHWKRRFVNAENLDRIARVLPVDAEFRYASDWAPYVDWTLARVPVHPDFEWTAAVSADWREPWAGWPGTRYEEKAKREGRTPAYLIFRRR